MQTLRRTAFPDEGTAAAKALRREQTGSFTNNKVMVAKGRGEIQMNAEVTWPWR